MDLRTGRMYETREAARADGVPESDIAEVVGHPERSNEDGEIVRFSSGPFKNRTYRRGRSGQLVRVD